MVLVKCVEYSRLSHRVSHFQDDFNDIAVLHLKLLWCLVLIDARAIKEKPDTREGDALAVTEGGHQLLHWR